MATTTTFTVGRDGSAVLISPYGGNITLPLLTQIKMTQVTSDPTSTPINTPRIKRFLPNGWDLTFEFDRSDATVDKLFSQIEAGWWAGGSADGGTNASGGVYLYFNETAGGQTTYQFAGVSFKLEDAGTVSADNPVKMAIAGAAQTRTVS